jgi:glycosyltransferase involved in cell wall biosynthesis
MFRKLQRPNAAPEQTPARDPVVLFISHDATRTGAPLILLRLLRWIRGHSSLKFGVLFRSAEGSLLKEFQSVAPTWFWTEDFDFRALQSSEHFDLAYSNTITNGAVLEQLAALQIPIVTHVHELEFWICQRMDRATLQQALQRTRWFVAASHACERVLAEKLGVPADRITVISEFVDTDQFRGTGFAGNVRAQLGIAPDAFVVGACGTTDWRKGPDLFVQLAAIIRKRRPHARLHFVWVGGDRAGLEHAALWHDVTRSGLTDCVHFIGDIDDPSHYFFTFDALALLSREDTFPIVMLEAAAARKPVVCFAGSGGAEEFVTAETGFVVPYLDLSAAADAFLTLMDDPSLRERLGHAAADVVRRRHDIHVVAPQLLRVIRTSGALTHANRSS